MSNVQITAPNGVSEFVKEGVVESKFAFNANEGGAHKVCFENVGDANRRVAFDFTAGVDAKDYE